MCFTICDKFGLKMWFMNVSRQGIAPNWGAIKQPAKNKAINDLMLKVFPYQVNA